MKQAPSDDNPPKAAQPLARARAIDIIHIGIPAGIGCYGQGLLYLLLLFFIISLLLSSDSCFTGFIAVSDRRTPLSEFYCMNGRGLCMNKLMYLSIFIYKHQTRPYR